MGSSTGAIPQAKGAASIALIGMNESDSAFLTDCFRQFKLQTSLLVEAPEATLRKEKFAGCVVHLKEGVEDVLTAARQSPSNRHMLIYGMATDPHVAMRYSNYGINVMFKLPLERNAALKVVRSTYLLAIHEYRRYVRVPVATEVKVDADGKKISTLSEEISNGGMSLSSDDLLPGKTAVRLTFTLPEKGQISINANICWRREPDRSFGVQFYPDDPNRHFVRQWIDNFLELD
jgi:hypothetical protein